MTGDDGLPARLEARPLEARLLAGELRLAAAQLQYALDALGERLEREGLQPLLAVDPNGRPLMLDGLAARGQVLAALAHLEARG